MSEATVARYVGCDAMLLRICLIEFCVQDPTPQTEDEAPKQTAPETGHEPPSSSTKSPTAEIEVVA